MFTGQKSLRAIALATALTIGCSSAKKQGKEVRPPKQPPEPPAQRVVPVDQALRDRARTILLQAVQSNDPIVRANGIEAIQDSVGEEGKGQILAGLEDGEPIVRFASAMACGQLKITAAKPKLILLLNDTDRSVQAAAVYGLHRLGDKRLTHHLEQTAVDQRPSVRADTAMILGRLGEPSALRLLQGMTRDSDPNVRWQVAESQWRLGGEDGLQTLVAGTASQFPDDQMICLIALAQPRDRRVSEHIRGKLVSDYPEISLIAARAMGMLGSDAGYAIALRGCQSVDPRLKSLAAFALGAIGRADAQPALEGLINDPNQNVRLAAAMAVLRLK